MHELGQRQINHSTIITLLPLSLLNLKPAAQALPQSTTGANPASAIACGGLLEISWSCLFLLFCGSALCSVMFCVCVCVSVCLSLGLSVSPCLRFFRQGWGAELPPNYLCLSISLSLSVSLALSPCLAKYLFPSPRFRCEPPVGDTQLLKVCTVPTIPEDASVGTIRVRISTSGMNLLGSPCELH